MICLLLRYLGGNLMEIWLSSEKYFKTILSNYLNRFIFNQGDFGCSLNPTSFAHDLI